MERLTTTNGDIWKCVDCIEESNCYGDICCNEISNVIQKLSEYEDIGCTPEQLKQIDKWYAEMCRELGEYKRLEEQGLILRLPCKVGDTAYYVHKGGIDEVEVDSFIVNVNLFVNVSLYIGCDRFGKTLTPYKTLFFTKEEAEQALADRKGV